MISRPSVAFFDLAGCEGCQLQVANLGEDLLDILKLIHLVEFRELLSETHAGRIDIAFVEGSVTNLESENRLYAIRQRSDLLVALGSCATTGGVNGIRNSRPLSEVQTAVYADQHDLFPTGTVRRLQHLVPVDYVIHGCPISPEEFIAVLKSALAGLEYNVPDYAVCVECLLNENVCMYDKGVTCLGPVTRAGCNAWCINSGNVCYGCRGEVSNPNRAGAEAVLRRYNLDSEQIANKMRMYNRALERSDG